MMISGYSLGCRDPDNRAWPAASVTCMDIIADAVAQVATIEASSLASDRGAMKKDVAW